MVALAMVLVAAAVPLDLTHVFDFDGKDNILEEDHFGIVNSLATVGINHTSVGAISGLWSPPYVSSDFLLELSISGQKVPAEHYAWRPFQVSSEGSVQGLQITSTATLVYGTRGGVVTVSIENRGEKKSFPFGVKILGTLDRVEEWGFGRPASAQPASVVANGNLIVKGEQPAIAFRTDLANVKWDAAASCWQSDITLGAGEKKTVSFAFCIGAKDEAIQASQSLMANPAKAVSGSEEEYARRVRGLFEKLPKIESDNAALVRFYNRSLVHLLMNRWEVPEFVIHPYYATGSVKGGCVCNYLWNYGENWEIMPLYDPKASRDHIKQFLKIDLTKHFAFDPMTGKAQGPWYPVNQEKIIGLVYFYVLNTGDKNFLNEMIDGKSILDWVLQNAFYGDDVNKPIALIDYGPSNSHLELRRGFPYNHVMPDLNGRRYANYLMTSELAAWVGKPNLVFKERAQALKALLKQRLWDPDKKWFFFEDEKGKKDLRYTVQVFKLFNSPVLDEEEEAGLLSHLNETEFLSAQGLHSMSKTDIAYDQVDIDNGGGGCCTSFPPQIAERLYKCGHADKADDIMGRLLWWGERLPYWGDSIVANSVDYRKDTPLQCTIDGAAIAQSIVFGMFGVRAEWDGSIVIDPHLPVFVQDMTLRDLKLRGKTIKIHVTGAKYQVDCGGKVVEAPVGKRTVVAR